MERRTFLHMLGSAALFAGCAGTETLPDGRGLVDTPEKRAHYLTSLLDEISALGPRPVGSPAYLKGTGILKREMERSLPVVELDPFTFERWIPGEEQEMMIGGTRIETYLSHGTSGTPPEGITGILKPVEEGKLKFTVEDGSSGDILAYISNRYDLAVPLPFYSHDMKLKSLPVFDVGKVDLPMLEKATADETPVRLKATAEFFPGTETANVVGRIPGVSDDEILFIAHYDTVYNTVGANDNTASVIVMLMIAHALSGRRLPMTLTFLATDGEEYDKLGAINYADRRRREGTFGNIRYLVNFDSLTWGRDLLISSRDADLHAMIAAIDRDLDLPGTPDLRDADGFALDGRPFRDEGIQAMYVNSTGFGNDVVWHRPEDIPESVPAECAELGFRVFSEYAMRIMAL